MTFDECCATLATKTGMTRDEWADFLSLDPAAQCAAAKAYKDQDWTKSGDTFAAVLAVLTVAGTIVGDVSGVAGAVSAVAALKAL